MTTPTPPPPPTPPAANTGATTPPPQPSFVPLPDDVAPVVPDSGAAVPGGGAGASTMALAAIGAVVIVGVAIIGGLAIFGGSDDATPEQLATPTTIALRETVVEVTSVPAPTTVGAITVAPVPETTVTPEATVAPNTVAPTTSIVPATTVPAPPAVSVPDSSPTDPNVEESKAVVRNGQIFLTGAVPNAQAGLEIEALAAEILGPQNVFNDYVIDPSAGDPNLGNITVEDTITFASASAVLDASSEGLLSQALALLNIRPAMTITIVGHTDDIGSEQNNLKLSQDRAESVKQWLVDRGIDSNRLAALGRGESEPIADNATPDGRRQNRRIQFFLENILGA